MLTAAGESTVLISETVGSPCFAAASIAGCSAVAESAFVRMICAPCCTAALYCCTCSETAVWEDAVVMMMFLSTSGLRLRNFGISWRTYAFHEFDGADQTIATLYGGLPFGFQFVPFEAMIRCAQPV